MNIIYGQANKNDIEELIRLRIAYMIDDLGELSNHDRMCMEKQLPDYFMRKLGTELIAFVARADDHIVGVTLLHITEAPASPFLPRGYKGEVLGVYTEPGYRHQGICTKLMSDLVAYGKDFGLDRIDLGATKLGYPVYYKVGFRDDASHYTSMTYCFNDNK